MDATDDAGSQSGHWQPAFRPNENVSTSQPETETQPMKSPSNVRVHEASNPTEISQSGSDGSPHQPTGFGLSLEEGGGNDDRLDPAWGIRRMDTTQVLAKANRSPSFPDLVSQLNSPMAEVPSHVAMNEVESIVQEVDGYTHSDAEGVQDQTDARNSDSELERLPPESTGGTFDPEYGHSPTSEDEVGLDAAESRFEEGLPLIPDRDSEESQAEAAPKSVKFDQIFDSRDEEADDSFFNEPVPNTESGSSRRLFERKTTGDVLDSLQFSSDDTVQSPLEEKPLREENKSDLQNVNKVVQSPHQAEKDDDVSAMWKAALEDDELLAEDEDDLLPDSEPSSPSSFLESLKAEGALAVEPDSAPLDLPSSDQTRSQQPDWQRAQPSNTYTPHQPPTSDLMSPSQTTYGNIGLSRPGITSMNNMQRQFQRPPPAPKAESFVDQAKEGYKSPYDLPMDLSKPRKRITHQPVEPQSGPPPPPRSSSMSSDHQMTSAPGQLQSAFSPTVPSFAVRARAPSAQLPPPSSPRKPSETKASPPSIARPASTSFFEELPVSSRPRQHIGQGRFTPQQTGSMAPPQLIPQSLLQHPSPPARPSAPSHPPQDPYAQYQLQPPERLDPYANVPLQPPPAPSNVSSRYSPAPTSVQAGPRPTPSPRYSPAPPPQSSNTTLPYRYSGNQPSVVQGPPGSHIQNRRISQPNTNITNVLPFQPRTSSPLAYHGKTVDHQSTEQVTAVPGRPGFASSPPETQYHIAPDEDQIQGLHSFPSEQPLGPSGVGLTPAAAPPLRSQTQSPRKMGSFTNATMEFRDLAQRPASVHGRTSPVRAVDRYSVTALARTSVRPRGLSQNLNFVQPTDGQENDELQRWKGAPIFKFGFGGQTVTCFPKHIPRYSAGSTMPMIKPAAGEVRVTQSRDVLQSSDILTRFPGPLRSKSKKKEVLSWMTERLAQLEGEDIPGMNHIQLPDARKRLSEKILLWRIIKILVEHDGTLDGSPEALKALNLTLSPGTFAVDESSATQYTAGSDLTGIYRPTGSVARADAVDPVAVDAIRKHLMRGNRDKAVWTAVDNRLWAHALLISSTLPKTTWKQVVQEFVRQEVKVAGANAESLAAVYEIFGGNVDESIDELVPPSARAGLQMVSKIDSAGPTKNALDGLDRWRETVTLVLNNRSTDDSQALAALARLLGGYGRVEASHLCHIFSRSPSARSIFGSFDDPEAPVVLLGADHYAHPSTFAQDDDAILLTEVYEFAVTILANNATTALMPHLQPYKLQRAIILAENGHKVESLAYCDAIAASLKSTTKVYTYNSVQLFSELDELSRRLKQAPAENSSSWIAKPSIEKVSGSVWNKFTSFVAGDESDAESRGSGKDPTQEAGPFANVTRTPSLSRSGSTADLYSMYSTTVPQAAPTTIAGSRYAPNTTRSSSELPVGRNSTDLQKSPLSAPSTGYEPASYTPSSSLGRQSYLTHNPVATISSGQSPERRRYQATPPQTSYLGTKSPDASPQRSYYAQKPENYVPTPPPEESLHGDPLPEVLPTPQSRPELRDGPGPHFGGYAPNTYSDPTRPEEMAETKAGATNDSTEQSYGYQPPTDSGYLPYEPDPESDTEQPKPRKKTFIDDDDDDDFPKISTSTSTAAPAVSKPTASAADDDAMARKRANNAAADAASDAAFRAAAEADAARDKEAKTLTSKGSGWFGGIWGGKKETSLDSAGSGSKAEPQKAIRAKLGEDSSFYYDKELKKWVNKKDPASLQAATKAVVPPPRGIAGSRGLTPSMSMPVMNALRPDSAGSTGPPSRTGTPGEAPNGSHPLTAAEGPRSVNRTASASVTPPPMGGPGAVAPPSRPATGMSNASSIDDLLGPPSTAGRKTVRSKKGAKGRYIDVMAKGE